MTIHSNRTTFLPMTDSLRSRIELAIDNLVALLDEIDGDENLEPSLGYSRYYDDPRLIDAELDEADDEPSLGWTNPSEFGPQGGGLLSGPGDSDTGQPAARSRLFDAQYGEDRELDPADDEPSLGWTEPRDQASQVCGGTDDLERDADDEPSEGWQEPHIHQREGH